MILVRPSVKSSSSSNLLAPAARALAGADIWPTKIAKLRNVSIRPRASSEITHFPAILVSPDIAWLVSVEPGPKRRARVGSALHPTGSDFLGKDRARTDPGRGAPNTPSV